MEREDILRVLRAHPENCIQGYHLGRPLGTGRTEGRGLVRHYGVLIADQISEAFHSGAVYVSGEDACAGNRLSGQYRFLKRNFIRQRAAVFCTYR